MSGCYMATAHPSGQSTSRNPGIPLLFLCSITFLSQDSIAREQMTVLPATVSKFRGISPIARRAGAQRQSTASGCWDSSLSRRRIISCWPDSRCACPSRSDVWPSSRRACPSRRKAWPSSKRACPSRREVMPSFTFHSRFRTHTSNAMSSAIYPGYRGARHGHQQRCPVHTLPLISLPSAQW